MRYVLITVFYKYTITSMSVSTSTISNRSKIKVVFLGDQNTGKTSIIERYINNAFYQNPDPTVGVDFIGKNISHNNQHFRLQLWDTAGQERFRSLVPNYLKDATCAVFVVDLSNEESIQQIHKWIQLFEDHRSPKAVSIICGNKKDLAPDFDMGKMQDVLSKFPMPFVQVSARTGDNISEIFPVAIEEVIKASNNMSTYHTQGNEKREERGEGERDRYHSSEVGVKLPDPLPTATFESNRVVLGGAQNEEKNKKRCC